MNAADRVRRAASEPWARALAALAVVFVLGCVFNAHGAFFAWSTQRGVLREISVLGILACGMTLVILGGGIDLSVSSVLALGAVSFALFSMPMQWPAWAAIASVLALGAALGLTNGLLVARAKLQPFIATLASMVFARGLAKEISGGRKITTYVDLPSGAHAMVPMPRAFTALDADVGGVAVVTIVFAACFVVTLVLANRTRFGRFVRAIGGNQEAARLAGVPVARTLALTYALSGCFAALAGICQAAQETHGDPETGAGYELDAIAMVVIGGTSLMGGRGGVGLTLIGALTLGLLQKILSLNAFSPETRLMLTGVVLVSAVLFQSGSRA